MPKPVVVTRAEPAGGPLSRELERLGMPVLRWPTISIVPADPTALRQALTCADFAWIVLTSRHGVAALARALSTPPGGARIAAVGPATAAALRAQGWPVDLTGEAGAESLVNAFETLALRGRHVLHVTSSRALPALSEGLKRLGAQVVTVEGYRTIPGSLDVEACRASIARANISAVTFASPSAVVELEHALGRTDFRRLLKMAPAAAIGPTTAHELTIRGISAAVAEPHTLRGLAECCLALAHSAHGERKVAATAAGDLNRKGGLPHDSSSPDTGHPPAPRDERRFQS